MRTAECRCRSSEGLLTIWKRQACRSPLHPGYPPRPRSYGSNPAGKPCARSSCRVSAASMSDVPPSDIAQQVADGKLDATPARVFSFDQIHEAQRVSESGEAGGKV